MCPIRPVVIGLVLGLFAAAAAADDLRSQPAWRKPAAAVLSADERSLAVANEGTGTISLLAAPAPEAWSQAQVVSESPVGKSLTDLAAIPGSDHFLATDAGADRVLLLRRQENRFLELAALEVPDHPISVSVSTDGTIACIASLWAQSITIVRVQSAPQPELATERVLSLGFSPRLQLALDDTHVLIADAFGGRLALVDIAGKSVRPLRSIIGGNIRGLALSHDRSRVVFAHSNQNSLAHTEFNDVHWGMLTNNVLREIPRDRLLAQTYRDRDVQVRQVGQPGFGAADLAGIVQQADGDWLVLSSGTGDLSVLQSPAGMLERINVGERPLKVLLGTHGLAFVVNQLSDSISVVDPRIDKPLATIALGPQPPATPASRGERLFFSAALSHDQWLSCHSCHVDGHTTHGLVDTHSDGTFGTPKRVLSLLGTRDANPWGWNGSLRELHDQVSQSITSSMQGPEPTPEQVSDIVAYLHTLNPAPPLAPPRTADERAAVAAGRAVFDREGCSRCHVPSLTFTTDAVFEIGLEDEQGLRKFNPPSLRGVSQRQAFLHDGRAQSLRSVFEDHAHQIPHGLSSTDLNALLEFLRSI